MIEYNSIECTSTEKINGGECNSIKAGDYEKDFMKIKFNSDDNLPYRMKYQRQIRKEGIDINKTNPSKECDICHCWYFEGIGFKYEPYLCNGCHDLMQKAFCYCLC